MSWRRGAKLTKPGSAPAYLHTSLQIQSISLLDPSDPSKGTKIRCLAASDKINSGRIRIQAKAWNFRRQGAPMLYEHGTDPRIGKAPLGRWDKFEVQEGVGLIAEGTLDTFDASDPRSMVVRDIEAKRITDVSVGHHPVKMGIARQGDDEFLDVQSTTLGEISFVSVGMDADATFDLMVASALGFEWQDDDSHKETGGNTMDRKLMIQMLNLGGAKLGEDANEAEILAAMQRMTQSANLGGKAADVLSALGLEIDAPGAAVHQAVALLKQPEGFVPKADFLKLQTELRTATVDQLLAQHSEIPEGQKPFAKALLAQGAEAGSTGRKLFEDWCATLPKVRTQSLTGRGSDAPPAKGQKGAPEMATASDLDKEWMQNLGAFRDPRSIKGIPKDMDPADFMAQMAEVSSSEALEWLFGQAVPETQMDKLMRNARREQMGESDTR